MAVTRRLFVLVVAMAWGLIASVAMMRTAAADAVFSVADVAVDVSAADAAVARSRAVAEGQRRALERLLRRIVPATEYPRLVLPDDDAITELVQGFEVAEERVAPKRYIASLTFHFKPNDVGWFLRNRDIPYAVTPGRSLVVLPLFRDGSELLLWEDDNPWRAAWANLPPTDGLVPMIIPIGELADLVLVDAPQAEVGERDSLAELAERYGASEVVVVEAVVDQTPLLDTPSVVVALRHYKADGMGIGGGRYGGTAWDTLETVLSVAANETRGQIEEEWKGANQLRFDRAASVSVDVPVKGLEDWLDIRGRLADLALVRKVEIAALSAQFARVVLHYLGDEQQLASALANSGLRLSRAADLWILRRQENRADTDAANDGPTVPSEPSVE